MILCFMVFGAILGVVIWALMDVAVRKISERSRMKREFLMNKKTNIQRHDYKTQNDRHETTRINHSRTSLARHRILAAVREAKEQRADET